MSADRIDDYPTSSEALALRDADATGGVIGERFHGKKSLVAAGWAVAEPYTINGADSWPRRRLVLTDAGRAALGRYRARLGRLGWLDTDRLARAAAALADSVDTDPDALRTLDHMIGVDPGAVADLIDALRELGISGWWMTT